MKKNQKIPLIGLGTWQLRGRECTKVVKWALEIGYRHIDTAHVYENHAAIRSGIKGFDREKIFITSKFLPTQDVKKSCDKALKDLGIDYLDLYLMHCPDRKLPMNEMFETLETLQNKGKVRNWGVSNFTVHHIKDMLKAGFKPFANQVEFHPYLYQKKLWQFCKKNEIELVAYRPLGKGALTSKRLFQELAKKYEKTPAQIILRWVVQKGIPVIPKAGSNKHLQENFDIFDFKLTMADMKIIDQIGIEERYCNAAWADFDY